MAVYDINYQPNVGASNPMGVYGQQVAAPAVSPLAPNGSVAGVAAPSVGSTAATPLGFNLGTANLALSGIGTLGNLWAAFQAQKLATEQFNFQKGITNTNLTNQIKSYNTSLVDRINARSFVQGDSQATTDKYIADNSLRDERK